MMRKTFFTFVSVVVVATQTPAALALISEDVSFANIQGVRITGKLFRTHWRGVRPAVVLLHGCSGAYSFSDPTRGVARLYTEWAERLTSVGYTALLVDSFTARGKPQKQCGDGLAGVSEVGDRPHDAYAALSHLLSGKSKVATDPDRVFLLGWSHGASSVFSSLSNTMSTRQEGRFRAGFAFYPGCGLYNAFGGITTSTYVPYAPLTIFHGEIDPLYTSGYCQTRLKLAVESGANEARGNPLQMIGYSAAQHSFDNARQTSAQWTVDDVSAKSSADAEVMNRLHHLTGSNEHIKYTVP